MRNRLFFLLLLLGSASPAIGQIISGQIFHNNIFRQYDLHLPPSWTQGDSLPLVFDLHYLGGDARDQDTLTNMNPIADTANFIICHPWGNGTNWNVGFNTPYPIGVDDVDFIRVLIDTLDLLYGVKRDQVYAMGMGQGGFMAHRLACELDDEIAAVAAVGASIADSAAFYCNSQRAVPLMIVHGTADSVVTYAGNPGFWPGIDDLISFWRGRNNCTGSPTMSSLPDLVSEGSTIDAFTHNCSDNTEILLYRVNNGGFSWPGATDSLPNSGIINQDINAGEHIWNFFQRFRLSGGMTAVEAPEAGVFRVWPNPVREALFVEVGELGDYRMELISMTGRVVWEMEKNMNGTERIDVKGLARGLYVLRVAGNNGVWSQRILVE